MLCYAMNALTCLNVCLMPWCMRENKTCDLYAQWHCWHLSRAYLSSKEVQTVSIIALDAMQARNKTSEENHAMEATRKGWSRSRCEAKTTGKYARRGAKPKQGPDSMHGCHRHVPGPTKCKGQQSKWIRRLKRKCSLLQVLDATISSVQCWTLG